MTTVRSIEAEFDRFVVDMIGERRTTRASRAPQPSITAQFIYEYALELVDCEGLEALTVRRLAAELKISTRTLYKRIGSRTNMIGELIELHSSRMNFDLQLCAAWEDTVWAWCLGLHQTLTAQPHLTLMVQDRMPNAVAPFVGALIDALVGQGVSRDDAVECCWSLADLTVNDAIGAARGMTTGKGAQAVWSPVGPSQNTAHAIKWIMRGIAAASGSHARRVDGV